MFKWIISDFFLKRQGLLLPAAHNKHIANKQVQTSFYYKPVRRIHPDYMTDTTRLSTTTKAKGATLSLDQYGFIPGVKVTEVCYSRGEPSSGLSALPTE
jgi:hypothetical protein